MYSVHAVHDIGTMLLLPALSAGFTKQQQQQQRLLPEHLMLFEHVTTKSDTCTLQNKQYYPLCVLYLPCMIVDPNHSAMMRLDLIPTVYTVCLQAWNIPS